MSTVKPTAEPPEDSTYPELMPVDELGRRPIKWDGNLASIKGLMTAVNEWRQENGILDTFFSHQAVDAGRGKLAIASLDSIHSFDTTAGDWDEPPTPAKPKSWNPAWPVGIFIDLSPDGILNPGASAAPLGVKAVVP